MKTMADVAPMLKKARERRKYSLQDVANLTGLSKAHVWDLENGHSDNPTFLTIVVLSKALGIKPASWF